MTLTRVWCLLSEQKKEHYWARLWSDLPGATIPSTGFGTSDRTCKAHLFHFEIIPPKNELKQFLQEGENLVFLLPSVLIRILN
jgi:Uri superfamily endonuclease